MQIIRPASHPYHKKRMIKRINEAKDIPSFYYALSHVWGLSEENRYLWNEIGDYVDDEEGQSAAPVPMRPEKRNTLLSMLKDHPDSYWWIDVLCARTDTPLDIMGDIYACCLECVVMIDCEPDLIPQINAIMSDSVDQSLGGTQQDYKKLRQQLNVGAKLLQCTWWTRVWTWQEMALPFGELRFVAETGTHRPTSNTMTLKKLIEVKDRGLLIPFKHHTRESMSARAKFDSIMTEILSARKSNRYRIMGRSKVALTFLITSLGETARQCMDPADYVYGALGMLQIKIPRMKDTNAVWQRFLTELDNCIKLEDGHRFIDYAQEFDLRKAYNASNVYIKLSLYLEENAEVYSLTVKDGLFE
ncbi:hypothetical protein LRAMOSA09101 [Lichtheimia ramosa]|uniref:Heterokaryon incompatibility domain-containing protein n=1 Tax=Lichtheimia ramosa TaxID=688394 RepID=A0A077WHU5_9FUNG|nr:hypothetical protein LRAMOSA09101 [Lichtheimia ramosa]